MAFKITDFVEDAGVPGIIAGIGAVLLAPVILPVVAGISKPVAKSLIKGGIVAYEKSKGTFAELGETLEDIIAEVRAELAEDREISTFEGGLTPLDSTSDHGA
ncbi:MAG: DUF5132 domain-containing protein [Gloeotrichia echinulata GP01]